MLPTVLFIIAAYTLYALVVGWCRWQRFRFLESQNKARHRWLTLAGGALSLGLLCYVIFWMAPAEPDQNLRLANILGVSEGEAWLQRAAMLPKIPLPLDQRQPDGQPAYALLHPESPPSLLPPAQPPVGNKFRKLKEKRSSVQTPKNSGQEARPTIKAKSKKKKTSKPSVRKFKRSEGSTG